MTWAEYAEGLLDLHRRVQTGAYRAPPVRRVEIPKPDGGTRPVAALEDKIVQKAVTEIILTPIYEPAFLGFSYEFRPGDALAVAIKRRTVNWIATSKGCSIPSLGTGWSGSLSIRSGTGG